jgi:hypothetical protein
VTVKSAVFWLYNPAVWREPDGSEKYIASIFREEI